MKKLLFALFGLLVITSCSKEHEPLPTPQVSIEAPAGPDPTQPIALTLGGTLTLKAVSANTDEATYLWEVNNEQVGQAQEYTFTATELGNYIVNVTVFNAEGTGNTVGCEVTVYGPYHTGTFILNEGNFTSVPSSLIFIGDDGQVTESVYTKANPTRKLGITAQDMCFFGGKAYILTQNGKKAEGFDGYLTVTNAETMTYVTDYTNDEFSDLSAPTHLAVVSADKAYIRDGRAIYVADLKNRKLNGKIAGSEGALKIKMVNTGSKVYAAAGSKLLVIDPASDAVTKTIDLPGTSSGIVLGKDGNIWSSCAGTPSYMVQILTATDAIGVKNEVKDINLSGGWVPSIGLCASKTDNVLYFWKDESPDWSHYDYPIYKHDCTTGKTEKFISLSETAKDGNYLIYGGMGVHPLTNQLFVNSIKGYGTDYLTNSIHSFSNQGKLVKTYSDKTSFPAGVFFKTE